MSSPSDNSGSKPQPAGSETGAPKSGGNFRWTICALLFFSVAVNYIDRNTIGILKGPLSEKLGWSEIDFGYITGAFSFAYAFGYLFGGWAINKIGVRRGLPIFVIVWSFAAMAHGLCGYLDLKEQFRMSYPWFSWAETSFIIATVTMPMTVAGFVFARILLGLSEGANFPAAIKVVAEWFPVKERALATGLFNAGTNIGAVICPISVNWMLFKWGWESAFYVTGATGFVWLIGWWLFYDAPETHKRLSPSELQYIKAGQPAVEEKTVKVPWIKLLGYRAVWAYIIAGILAAPAWGFYQFYLPDFLKKGFHVTQNAAAWWTSTFYIIAAIGGVVGGWLAGQLLAKGWSLNAARKFSLLCCALAVVPVFLAPKAPSAWVAVVILGIAGSAHQGWSANLFSFVSDTMPKEAISSVVGLGGFVGYFTGGFVNTFTGYIVQKTGSYAWVFLYFSGTYVVSLLAMHLLVPRIGQKNAP